MFSVVIPAYNCERTIISAIESVLAQTRMDLIEEIIVVNDGSKDATDSVIRGFLSSMRTPCPIRYYTQENRGASSARNRAIREAKAPWIALLDSDDRWKLNKIERVSEIISSNPKIKLLASAYPLRILFRKRHGLVKLTPQDVCIRATLATPSVVFERSTGLKLGLFNEAMQYAEDFQFFQKFLLCDGCYVLAEDLVEIDCGKSFSAERGLSSHLREMHLGRRHCVRDLYEMGLISSSFMRFISVFNELKYIRRVGISTVQRWKFEILKERRKYFPQGFSWKT